MHDGLEGAPPEPGARSLWIPPLPPQKTKKVPRSSPKQKKAGEEPLELYPIEKSDNKAVGFPTLTLSFSIMGRRRGPKSQKERISVENPY